MLSCAKNDHSSLTLWLFHRIARLVNTTIALTLQLHYIQLASSQTTRLAPNDCEKVLWTRYYHRKEESVRPWLLNFLKPRNHGCFLLMIGYHIKCPFPVPTSVYHGIRSSSLSSCHGSTTAMLCRWAYQPTCTTVCSHCSTLLLDPSPAYDAPTTSPTHSPVSTG